MEKAMAPHSSTLAWKIPWTEEPGRLQYMGSLRVGHDWATSLSLFTFVHWRRKWQPTQVFLPGESQGRWSLLSYHLWGGTVGHDLSDLAAAATGIPSPPLALFIVVLPKAHLTSHSRMSGSKWVWAITPSWLSGSWRSFLDSSSVYSCHLFLIFSASISDAQNSPSQASTVRELWTSRCSSWI